MEVKEDDVLYLDSENGLTYQIEVININDYREPSMKYAIDLIDCNGVRYSEVKTMEILLLWVKILLTSAERSYFKRSKSLI